MAKRYITLHSRKHVLHNDHGGKQMEIVTLINYAVYLIIGIGIGIFIGLEL